MGAFLTSLHDLNSRLDVGLNFQDYSNRVGDIKVVYDQIPFDSLDPRCTTSAGVPAEAALNKYIAAFNTWNKCISNLGCTNASIKGRLQADWAAASADLTRADSGLQSLLEAA